MSIHRRISIALLAAAATLALAGSALAAPGSGAYVLDDSHCQTSAFGTTCSDEHGVFKITDAGTSGYQNVVSNYRSETTFTGAGPIAGCVSSSSSSINNHQLLKADELGQLHFTMTYGSSLDCNGATMKCTTQTDYTASGGEVRVDRTRTICADPV